LGSRFEEAVRRALKAPDATTQIAVAQMLGEMGFENRYAEFGKGPASPFGPDLARLVSEGKPEVRQAVARELGRISPNPGVAMPVLKGLMKSNQAADRSAATEGCFNLIRSLVGDRNSWNTRLAEGTLRQTVSVTKAVLTVTASALT